MLPYHRMGSGPRHLVFLHGVNQDHKAWDRVLGLLADEFTCWAVTLPPPEVGLSESARQVAAFLEAQRIQLEALVGHSYGADLAMELLAQGVRPKMLFISSYFCNPRPSLASRFIVGALLRVDRTPVLRRVFRRVLRFNAMARELMAKAPPRSYLAYYSRAMRQGAPATPAPEVPIVVIAGMKDWFMGLSGRMRYDALRPLAVVPLNAPHWMTKSHPEDYAAVLRRFLLGEPAPTPE